MYTKYRCKNCQVVFSSEPLRSEESFTPTPFTFSELAGGVDKGIMYRQENGVMKVLHMSGDEAYA